MSRAIALFNQAGGVGKTTITQNLGYQLSARGHKVLLIDLDPQASLTTFMGIDPDSLDKTLFDTLVNEEPLFILPSLHGMALAPTNITLSAAEIQLVNMDFREVRLSEALDPIRDDYDFILIDCPPSLGLLSYSALVGATHVLVLIETHYKAFQGTNLLLQTVAKVRKRGNPKLQIAGFVPSRYAASNSQDKRTLKAIQEQLATVGTFSQVIVSQSAIAQHYSTFRWRSCRGSESIGLNLFRLFNSPASHSGKAFCFLLNQLYEGDSTKLGFLYEAGSDDFPNQTSSSTCSNTFGFI